MKPCLQSMPRDRHQKVAGCFTEAEPRRKAKPDEEAKMNTNAITPTAEPDVVYIPDFLPRDEADALLANIKAGAEFQQNYIQLFGRKAVPRLEAWYGPWEYPYSKGVILKAAPMPNYLQVVIERMKTSSFGEYNGVLINRYRDGKDYVNWHSDDDYGDPQ